MMKINIFVDDGISEDFSEHQLELSAIPDKEDVIYFDGAKYVVTHREFYIHDRLTESTEKSKASYNIYLLKDDDGVQKTRDKIFSRPLHDTELSVRTSNTLFSANIKSVGDLVRQREWDLIKTPGYGKKSIKEVRDFLMNNNLKFQMTEQDIIDWN